MVGVTGRVKRLLVSVALGLATFFELAGISNSLPYDMVGWLTDALSLPGLVVGRLLYPAGVHTGGGAPYWGWVFLASSTAFYGVLWYVVLGVADSRRRRQAPGGGKR
jgi:hypothetical protein